MPGPVNLASHVVARHSTISTKLNPRENTVSGSKAWFAIAIVIGVLVCASFLLCILVRHLRRRQASPTWLPGAWLKERWVAWTASSSKRNHFSALSTDRSASEQRSRPNSNADSLNTIRRSGTSGGLSSSAQSGTASTPSRDADGVDRHQSVRSIMTLPAYSADARPEEQIIGREGERAGIDMVVDFPETVDEEEARREEEMEALYQIRRARREERASRDERRRLRREARARGDTVALGELRLQGRQSRDRSGTAESSSAIANVAANNLSSEGLIREHRSQERGRRVSSVSYMDLGIARHDGSRVRADSGDSDRQPLMDSAAQMGGVTSGGRDRSGSGTLGAVHLRNMSTSSLSRFMTPDISDDERSSVDFEVVPTPGRDSRAASQSNSRPPPRLRLNSATSLDRGTELQTRTSQQPPLHDTAAGLPQYDDLSPIADANEPQSATGTNEAQQDYEQDEAPAYESPSRTDAPRIPAFARLPTIQVTPFSPVVESTGERDWSAAGTSSTPSVPAQ